MFLNGTLDVAWIPCQLQLEDSRFFGPKVVKLTRYRVDEADHAAEVKSTIDSRSKDDIADEDDTRSKIEAAITLALQVEPMVRDDAIATLWQAILANLNAFWDKVQSSATSDDLESMKEVDVFIDGVIKKMKRPDGDFQTKLLELRAKSLSKVQKLGRIDSSFRLATAIDAYTESPTSDNFKTLKTVVLQFTEKIGNPELLAKIHGAMKTSIKVALTAFVGMTPVNLVEQAWVTQLQYVKEVCTLFAKQVYQIIAAPTSDDQVLLAWHRAFAKKLVVYGRLSELRSLSSDAGEQFETDDGNDIFQGLLRDRREDKLDEWKQSLPLEKDESWDDEDVKRHYNDFKDLEQFCGSFDAEVDLSISQFQVAAMGLTFADSRKLVNEGNMKGGGMDDGSDYKGQFKDDPTASYDQILAQANATIFDASNRGVAKRLQTLKESLAANLKLVSSEAKKYGYDLKKDKTWLEIKASLDEALKWVSITAAECKIMHNISKDSRAAKALRQSHVDKVLVQTQTDSADKEAVLKVHDALKKKAHEFMR
jgi:hypothetical protein